MSLFFCKGEYIYCNKKHNIAYKKVLICTLSTSAQAHFKVVGEQKSIILGQYQNSLDGIEGRKISKETNPEYFL